MKYVTLSFFFRALIGIWISMSASLSNAQLLTKPYIEREARDSVVCGDQRMELYLPMLTGKNVAIVANATSVIESTHLVDTLLNSNVSIQKVFAPEHGFRGNVPAGETVVSTKDEKTGIPIVSLYGKNKKPTAEQLKGIDIVIFDIQDVGARFYTYISTLHYVMEACAESNIPFIVLDRPNPNGFYVDGPVLQPAYSSFVGVDPIALVHGCTVGELAQMINGEKWLAKGIQCDLTVIPCMNYTHKTHWELLISPSPNLPNMSAIYLYPSLCLFEGTIVSVGRGTTFPFQCIGYPGNTTGKYTFVPTDMPGIAMNPPHEGQLCHGHFLNDFGSFYFTAAKSIYLEWICGLYEAAADKEHFFTSPDFFDKLAGNGTLRQQIIAGMSPEDIRKSWQPELQAYKEMRKKYLLYPDFD